MYQSTRSTFGAVAVPSSKSRKRAIAAPVLPFPEARPDKPTVCILTQCNILPMVSLQRDHLDQDKMVFRDKTPLWWFFETAGSAFGAFKNGELVSMILMSKNDELPAEVRNSLDPSSLSGQHAVIGGALVAKDYKGMGLGRDMIECCIQDALLSHLDHLHARVRIGNDESLNVFKKAGFTVLPETGPSPDTPDYTVHFLYMNLQSRREAWKKPNPEKVYRLGQPGL